MKSTTLLAIFTVILVAGGVFLYIGVGKDADVNAEVISEANAVVKENIQQVTLSMKDYNYYPQTIKVKEGTPLEITLDNSLYGCLRSITIKEFGVSQISKSPEEKINFIPNKKGTFAFSCSMGMGYGKLVVE